METIQKCIQTVTSLEEEGTDIMNNLERNKEIIKSSQDKVYFHNITNVDSTCG